MTEELYFGIFWKSEYVNLSSKKYLFLKIEGKVACVISLFLTGMGWICFSQKFAKGGDCWIFVCWLHFCLKQIFTSDVEHNVPTSRVVLYILGWPMFMHAHAWLKESIPACVGMNRVQLWRDQNICDFLRNWWNDLGKYFYVTFNKPIL